MSHGPTPRKLANTSPSERHLVAAHVIETEGQIALAAGKPKEAIELATESLRLADESGNRKAAVSSGLSLAKAQRASGDLDAAASTLERAAELAEGHGRRGQLS